MSVNLGNLKTTICGALTVIFTALSALPGLEAYAKILQAFATVAGALGLYFAKDATTGSTPDGKL
jgi:hypothetical protein